MDGGKCILQLRGVRPFFSDKYDITRHKNYPLLLDSDEKNLFDIEKYVQQRRKMHPNYSSDETFTEYGVDINSADKKEKNSANESQRRTRT